MEIASLGFIMLELVDSLLVVINDGYFTRVLLELNVNPITAKIIITIISNFTLLSNKNHHYQFYKDIIDQSYYPYK